MVYGETFYGRHTAQHQLQQSKLQVKKGLPLEKKNTQNHENRRLGLIESLHMQHCSLRGCIRPLAPLKRYSNFRITTMGSMTPKEIKYKLHYYDARETSTAATWKSSFRASFGSKRPKVWEEMSKIVF